MFVRLFLKECKQTAKCTTYYIIVACLVFFYITQLGNFEMLQKPVPGQESYGISYSKDEGVIMDSTLSTMLREYIANRYTTYPIGFYKEVTLNIDKQSRMFEILVGLTGLNDKELSAAIEAYLTNPEATGEQLKLTIADGLTYDEFKDFMKQADKLLGSGSNYSENYIMSNARVPMTYEDALQDYNEVIKKDKLSGAYARLFCDYLGIVLAILPVFLAVTRGLRDKRARVNQIIYTRSVTSFSVIMSRYLSIVIMLMLPVLLIAGYMTVQCLYSGTGEGVAVDALAFFKYSLGWLLPAVMISTSVGIALTELTETAIAIVVMGIWWFISLFMGVVNIRGGYGWNLIPRHNSLGNYQVFHDNFNILAANRLFYAALALFLVAAAVYIFDLKRRGKFIINGKVSSNSKSKS